MNKAEIVDQIASENNISKSLANVTMDTIMNLIVTTLKKGEKITIVGFGSFSVSDRAARNARNPQTGEIIKIKARKVPSFKASKEFAATIAEDK